MTNFNPKFRIEIKGDDDVVIRDCDNEIYKRLGRLIYDASKDDGTFNVLQGQTRAELLRIGVKPDLLVGIDRFEVVKDEDNSMNIVIPKTKDENDTAAFPTPKAFDRYLVELAIITIRACKR